MCKCKINKTVIDTVIQRLDGSPVKREFMDALTSLEDYHYAAYQCAQKIKLITADYQMGAVDRTGFMDECKRWDRNRKYRHDEAIKGLLTINRICKSINRFFVAVEYDGEISLEAGPRIDLADAIVDYVNSIVESRKK
jgi:hypothetical protein